jgi:hypothetical protein
MGELMGRELAEKHGTGPIEPRHRRRIFAGDIDRADLRVARRADVGGAVDILESERDAVQRPAIVPAMISRSAMRACSRAFSGVGSRNALTCRSNRSMRASSASSGSTGDNRRRSSRRASSAIVSRCSSGAPGAGSGAASFGMFRSATAKSTNPRRTYRRPRRSEIRSGRVSRVRRRNA